jgi:hypothetical protein
MSEKNINSKSSYAVLPSFVMDDDNLNEGAKILYARISMYSQEGRCWASNDHFAEKQQVTTRCIQKWLAELKDAGYIEVDIEKGGFQTKRDIWIVNDFKKMFTRRTVVRPEANGSSPSPEPQFTHINTSDINIKEQQQPAAVFYFDILEKVSISGDEKVWLSQHFPVEDIQIAIDWATHPNTVLSKPLAAALKWACKAKPIIQETLEEKITSNKKYTEELSKIHTSKHYKLEAYNTNAYIEPLQNGSVCVIKYDETGFKEILKKELIQRGFDLPI